MIYMLKDPSGFCEEGIGGGKSRIRKNSLEATKVI